MSTMVDILASRGMKVSDSYQSAMVELCFHRCCMAGSLPACSPTAALRFGRALSPVVLFLVRKPVFLVSKKFYELFPLL